MVLLFYVILSNLIKFGNTVKDKLNIVLLRTIGLSLLLLAFLGKGQSLKAQDSPSALFDLTLEWQTYPAGTIPGLRAEWSIGAKSGVHLRAGYNIVRHRDLGIKDDERGGGFGFSLGYRRFLREGHRGWHGGLRCDLWFNSVEWTDKIDQPDEIKGTTEVTVLQPTAEVGYLFSLKNGWIFTPSIALGAEINIVVDGQEVGEGAILLIGLQFGKRFGR